MIYLISLGIKKEDLSSYVLEKIKNSDLVFIEKYTSFFKDYDWLISFLKENNVNYVEAERSLIEEGLIDKIKENRDKNISILVFGDFLMATTHNTIILELKKLNLKFELIHNVSVFNLVTRTGLSIYKFGKTISIPFLIRDKRLKIETPIKVIKENDSINAHTLLLLDLDPINNDYLKAEEALEYLSSNGIKENLIVCSRLYWDDERIILIKNLNEEVIEKVKNLALKPPICIVRFSKLNVVEEEFLNTLDSLN